MLRVLRPLRMISRNKGLKLAVLSLMNAIPSIINALTIALLFFTIFAIFGTNQFKGKFYMCNTTQIVGMYGKYSQIVADTHQTVTKWDCLNHGGEWLN